MTPLPSATPAPLASPVAQAPLVPTGASVAATSLQPPAPPAGSAGFSSAGSIGSAVVALLLVVGLILLLARLAKRLPGLGVAAHPELRVVATLALGPRDRLVVVNVGPEQILLGVGSTGIRPLHTLAQPLPEAAPDRLPFAQLLAQRFRKDAE